MRLGRVWLACRAAPESRRRQATALIAGSLLVALLCIGLGLYQRSTSNHAHQTVAGQAPTLPVTPSQPTPYRPATLANHDVRGLAPGAGDDAVPYRPRTQQVAAITPILSDGPPTLHPGSNRMPPRPAVQSARDAATGAGHASSRAAARSRHGLLAIPIVVAGLQTSSQDLILHDLQHAAAVREVPARPTPTPTPAHRLQVWVTGYTLTGTTALGTQAGPGICAVDPAVIPLGTHITVEGFGTCSAEDTGPEVMGAHVDVWVPTVSEAYALTGWHWATW